MDSTVKFELPLVQASQSQKHITVNEALTRLEAMSQLRIETVATPDPPLSPIDGGVFGVPAGATGLWDGKDGSLAIFSNGGWEFVTPVVGWRAWDADANAFTVFDGGRWVPDAVAISENGASTGITVLEFDHALQSGLQSTTAETIPAQSVVFAVTGRILSPIEGASSFDLGIDGATDRYGSGFGVGQGAWFRGITGQPVTYYSAAALRLTANGGEFTSGAVRLAVHCMEFGLPRA